MHLLPELASHHAVSIPELLVSRDERQARQHVWLKRHPVPLVSFTVVAPGPIKDSEVTRRIFNHGVTALRALAAKQGWQIQEQAALVSASGPDHAKVFEAAVLLNGEDFSRGKGHSKKEAEQAAARTALKILREGN